MRFTATTLIMVLVLLVDGMAKSILYQRIPYGMSEFGPFRGENLFLAMPLSRNLTQIERLSWAEKCIPFRQNCTMAEECCSLKCLVHIKRCNA